MKDKRYQKLPFVDQSDGYIRMLCPSCSSTRVRMEAMQLETDKQTRIDIATGQITTTPQHLARHPSVQIEGLCVRGHTFDLIFRGWFGAGAGDFLGVTVCVSPEGKSRSDDPYEFPRNGESTT